MQGVDVMETVSGHGKFINGKLVIPNPYEQMFRKALKINLETEGGRQGLKALGISIEKAKKTIGEK